MRRARRVPPHPVLPLIRSLPEPLLQLSAGSHWLHLAATESADAESFLTGIEADPLAEEVGGGVPAPVGTGGAVVPVAAKNQNNVPCGTVVRAYWQGYTVHVEMADGWHFVYDDFNGYSSRWKP